MHYATYTYMLCYRHTCSAKHMCFSTASVCISSRPLICTRDSATDTCTMIKIQILCYRHICSAKHVCSSSRPLICTRDGGAASVCLGLSQTTQRPPGTLHVKHTTGPFLHLANIIGKIPLAIWTFCNLDSAKLPKDHLALSSMLKNTTLPFLRIVAHYQTSAGTSKFLTVEWFLVW